MADLQWNRAFALEQTGGDQELLDELITLFKDSSASDFEQLCAAVEAGNSDGIVAAAHSLKGASASLGIEGVRKLATEMEADARQGSLAKAQAGIGEMQSLLEELRQL